MHLYFLSSVRESSLHNIIFNTALILPAADYTPPYNEGLPRRPDDIKFSRKKGKRRKPIDTLCTSVCRRQLPSSGSDFFDKTAIRFVGRNFNPNLDDNLFSLENRSETAGSTLNWQPQKCQCANANRRPSNSGKSFSLRKRADRQGGFSP